MMANVATIDVPKLDTVVGQSPYSCSDEVSAALAPADSTIGCCYRVNAGVIAAMVGAHVPFETLNVRLGHFALMLFARRGLVEMRFPTQNASTLVSPRSVSVAIGRREDLLMRDVSVSQRSLLAIFVDQTCLTEHYRFRSSGLSPSALASSGGMLISASTDEPILEILNALTDVPNTEAFAQDNFAPLTDILLQRGVERVNSQAAPTMTVGASSAQSAMVEAAMSMYRGNMASQPKVDDLARRFRTTRAKLVKAFRDYLGMSPGLYGRAVRMKWASSALIEKTMPIAEISDQTGYANPAAFSRAFRAHFRHRPTEHAKMMEAGRYDRPAHCGRA